jgi:hypothetical protein
LRQAVAEPRNGKDRKTAAHGEQQREHRGAADADQEVTPPTPVVAESSEEQLPERRGEHAKRAERADVDERLAVADATTTELFREERSGHREVCTTVVTGGIAREQQKDDSELRQSQRAGVVGEHHHGDRTHTGLV